MIHFSFISLKEACYWLAHVVFHFKSLQWSVSSGKGTSSLEECLIIFSVADIVFFLIIIIRCFLKEKEAEQRWVHLETLYLSEMDLNGSRECPVLEVYSVSSQSETAERKHLLQWRQPMDRVGVGTYGIQQVTKIKDVKLPALASCGRAQAGIVIVMVQGATFFLVWGSSESRKKLTGIRIRRTLLFFCLEYEFLVDMVFH